MMKQISEKAKDLIENLRKFAVQDEIGGRINKVAGARVASIELEDYIAQLEAENRALRHALYKLVKGKEERNGQ